MAGAKLFTASAGTDNLLLADGSSLTGSPQISTQGFVVQVNGALATLAGIQLNTSAAFTFAASENRVLNLSGAVSIASGSALTINAPAAANTAKVLGIGRVQLGQDESAHTILAGDNAGQLTLENVQFGDAATLTLGAAKVVNALVATPFTFGTNATSGDFTNVTFTENVLINTDARNGLANNGLVFEQNLSVTGAGTVAHVISGGSIGGNLFLDGNQLTLEGTVTFDADSELTHRLPAGKLILGSNAVLLGGIVASQIRIEFTSAATISESSIITDVAIDATAGNHVKLVLSSVTLTDSQIVVTLNNGQAASILELINVTEASESNTSYLGNDDDGNIITISIDNNDEVIAAVTS